MIKKNNQGSKSKNSWITIISIISLVVSLLMGVVTIWSAIKAIDANKSIKVISEEISTKYIGQFAEASQMTEIINRIYSANTSLTIVTDVPAYCCFSNPGKFDEYQKAIGETIRRESFEKLKIYYYALDQSVNYFCKQFNITNKKDGVTDLISKDTLDIDDLLIDAFKKREGFKEKCDIFLNAFNSSDSIRTLRDLHLKIYGKHKTFLNSISIYNKTKLYEIIDKELYMFFWIIDTEICSAFSFCFYNPDVSYEVSFQSRDANMIKFLNATLKDIQENSREGIIPKE